jgi:N-glycosylase/DNA lyase
MNLAAINQTIKAMCPEVGTLGVGRCNWRLLTEEELLYQAASCMFSSRMRFEVAKAAADCVRASGLLNWEEISTRQFADYEAQLQTILSKPVSVVVNGSRRQMLPRFRNRLASLLAKTVETIHWGGSTLREILFSARSSRHARKCLAETISGFGPKQASLFLRRVGFCSDLAILDTHILDYLKLARGIDPKPSALSRLSSYEIIETEFQGVAAEFGYPVGCVDLAIWITMRIAKREGLL